MVQTTCQRDHAATKKQAPGIGKKEEETAHKQYRIKLFSVPSPLIYVE
jgi:hypothetical protein